MPYIHEYWDQYHGIEDDEWWFESWDESDHEDPYWDDGMYDDGMNNTSEYVDYDSWDCDAQDCEWVDCEAWEQIDSMDCWKQECTGCGEKACQLYHWIEEKGDWDIVNCDGGDDDWENDKDMYNNDTANYYNDEDDYYYEDPVQSDLEEVGDVLNSFNNSASEATDKFCQNFTCIEMLGQIAGAWVNSSETQMAAEQATQPVDMFLHDDDATHVAD